MSDIRTSKRSLGTLMLFAAVLLAAPGSAAAETFALPPSFSIGIDTFGLPTSLTILEGEKPREDLELKESVRHLLIAAAKSFFDGNLEDARSRIEDGLQKKYYILPQKRVLSRVYFMSGRLDSSISVAREIASDTDAVVEDQRRLEFLQGVERYLKISLETQPLAYSAAAIVRGDEKSRHRFITPVGVEVDRFGRILQTSFGTDEVVVFSKGLEFEMKLSGISNPFDVAVDADAAMYVTSFGGDRVHRYGRDGTSLGTFGRKGSGPGEFFGPEGIVISPDHYVFVVDAGNHRIQKFTLDGKFLMAFGHRGTKPGELISPRSVAIEPAHDTQLYRVLVLSQDGHLLQRFDRFGNFLGIIGTAELAEPRDFDWLNDRELLFCTARGELATLQPGADTLSYILNDRDEKMIIDGMSGLAVDDEAGFIYVATQTTSDLRVLQPGTLAEKTLLNITDLDFDHYPFIGVTLQVMTGSGDPITGLTRRNFAALEDNHRAVPVSVNPLTQIGPLNLVIHLDPSASLDRRMVLIRSFLTELSRELPSEYFLSIRKGRKEILRPTDNPYLIRKSLERISEPLPGSLVRDIYESLETFKAARGRRNILLVTSRTVDLPQDQFPPLFLHLVNRGISLFVLHLSDQDLPVLKTLCRRTGGNYRNLRETSISDMAFELASSKNASYFLVYSSPYGELQTHTSVDLVLRLFYLSDAVSDRIRYFAP